MQLLGDGLPNLMVTDPPYGVEYDPAWRHGAASTTQPGKVKSETMTSPTGPPAWELVPGQHRLCLARGAAPTIVAESLVKAGFTIRAQIIWAKERLVIGQGDYHWQHEPCWYAVRKQGQLDRRPKADNALDHLERRSGCRDRARHAEAGRMHAPADAEQLEPGQAVYEPFLGSGTTLIAAESCGRVCLAIEIEPAICRCRRPPLAGIHR